MRHRVGHCAACAGGNRAARDRRRRVLHVAQPAKECSNHQRPASRHAGSARKSETVCRTASVLIQTPLYSFIPRGSLLLFDPVARRNLNKQNGDHNGKPPGGHLEQREAANSL